MTSLRTFTAATLLVAFSAAVLAQADTAKKPPVAKPAATAASGMHGGEQHGKGTKKGHSKDGADCKSMMDKQHGKDGQAKGHDKMANDCPGMK